MNKARDDSAGLQVERARAEQQGHVEPAVRRDEAREVEVEAVRPPQAEDRNGSEDHSNKPYLCWE